MKSAALTVCLLSAFVMPSLRAEGFIVENGQARSEIVIADEPTRSVRMAAQELQDDIQKISGAHLPIVTRPSGTMAKIFVGRSAYTDALKLTAEGLSGGAYRIVSGEDWLVLLGEDADFTPRLPFARNNGDIARAQAEWETLTKSLWGMPNAGLYKHRLKLPASTGKPEGAVTDPKETFEIWGLDERGSFNAVCGFLHQLGARWYLPGELGEVLPSLKTIALPEVYETVRPDFALRQFNFRFGTAGVDTAKWVMRLGTRNDDQIQIAHGMASMTGREAIFAGHPEWFALYGTKRDYTRGDSKNQLCYSNEELFRETVRYCRAALDIYQLETVSVMPPDGYSALCQCPQCKGKDSPERNERGRFSDHVWDFTNRVAREVAKTHPHGKILNCAYGAYTLPPLRIDKLEPNVVVCIVGGRRPIMNGRRDMEGESAPEALRAAWAKKTDNPLLIFENYPLTARGWYLPAFSAHALGNTVNATKGVSRGEDIWLSTVDGFGESAMGFNAFLVYFTARMYWGGKEADVDAMFREYCRLFYGPSELEMHDFFTYCEANWSAMEDDASKANAALELFAKAKAKVEPASLYGQRIALIDSYLKGLRLKAQQMAQKRGPVPVLRLVGDANDIVVDGKLDDAYWQVCTPSAIGALSELQTGRAPAVGTMFKAGWGNNSVYFAIRCDEPPGEKLNVTTTRSGDPALFQGDAVEIELSTETHSYYQIAINPSGAIMDLDRAAPKGQQQAWSSQAEVATHIAEDHWTVEIRIPVTQDENDPLHQVIGRKPTQSLPWHINVCRQRIREDGAEYSAFSPTGTEGFHEPMKFAHFFSGRSFQFEADPAVTDVVIALRNIARLGKPAERLPACLKLAEGKLTDLQKAEVLEQASMAASSMRDFSQADTLIASIPIEAVKKTARMKRLKAVEVAQEFEGENIDAWPFWQRAEGYFSRGRAFATMGRTAEAEKDLTRALRWTSDKRLRESIAAVIEKNKEANPK